MKEKEGYIYEKDDIKLDNTFKILKLQIQILVLSFLAGSCEMYGEMILGPFFLSYNMIPIVMCATNQYI